MSSPDAPDVSPPKRTPLFEAHRRAGARTAPFGGWEMPIQYSGIVAEHKAVRTAAGLFDISHMGEFIVRGPGGRAWLNTLFSNNLDKISAGQSLYGFLLNENGGVIDDLIVYEMFPEVFALVVNAAKIEEDFAWMQAHLPAGNDAEGMVFENGSDRTAAVALQGPRAEEICAAFFGPDVSLPPRHSTLVHFEHGGIAFLLSRTGYTGEDGFELFFPTADAETVWNGLLETGAPFGLLPCGLGARDTLRLEVCYPLNGSDLAPTRTPLEAGLGFFVDLQTKGDFIGRAALLRQKTEGVKERLVAFRMTEKSPPPRSHYLVLKDGFPAGETTSGGLAPSLDNAGIGLAYLAAELARPGETVEIDIRGRRFGAVIEKKPLYRRPALAPAPLA